jgi:hypothetical protein
MSSHERKLTTVKLIFAICTVFVPITDPTCLQTLAVATHKLVERTVCNSTTVSNNICRDPHKLSVDLVGYI